MIRLGQFEIHAADDGSFWFDGGAMFGIVPRTIWERLYPPDERNRVRLGLNSLLVRAGRATLLVETGMGRKLSAKERQIYAIDESTDLLQSLAAIGVRPEEVDVVINSHLHLDHCGWNTMRDKRGRLVPTFPRARYVIQRGEWEAATHPTELTTVSYEPESFEPIERGGLLDLVDGDAEIAPGVRVEPIAGHTRCHQIVLFDSEGRQGAFLGDLIPTAAHLRKAYFCAFDASAEQMLESKRQIVRRALAEDWTVFYVHDPRIRASRLRPSSDAREFARAEPVEL